MPKYDAFGREIGENTLEGLGGAHETAAEPRAEPAPPVEAPQDAAARDALAAQLHGALGQVATARSAQPVPAARRSTGARGCLLGLLVAGSGVYGLTQYLALGRTREMALRAALGAAPFQIARLVAGQCGVPLVAGTLAGLAASLAITNVLQHLLPGVPAVDVRALTVATVALVTIGGVAVAIPAWRAMRMEPARALRSQ